VATVDRQSGGGGGGGFGGLGGGGFDGLIEDVRLIPFTTCQRQEHLGGGLDGNASRSLRVLT